MSAITWTVLIVSAVCVGVCAFAVFAMSYALRRLARTATEYRRQANERLARMTGVAHLWQRTARDDTPATAFEDFANQMNALVAYVDEQAAKVTPR